MFSVALPSLVTRKARPVTAASEPFGPLPRSNVEVPEITPRSWPLRIMLTVTSGIGPVPAATMLPKMRKVNGASSGSLLAIETKPSRRPAVVVVS